MIKYAGLYAEIRLLNLINECWNTCKIPENWKIGEVISLFKKGNRLDSKNYRGISLLNSTYKLYAKIINNRLKIISNTLLEEEQAGFRKGRSCSDNVFIIKRLIEKRREFNLSSYLLFVDFEKAFDRVNRTKLWAIMKERGYPHHLIKSIQSLYEETKIVIKADEKKSEEILINQGVRQGCSLSPTLFNIYIDDIMKQWKMLTHKGLRLNNDTSINNLIFADDLVLLHYDEDLLQLAAHKLNEICKDYNLKISINKTKVMAFSGKNPLRAKIIIDDQMIEQVSHYKYLGCDISYGYDKDIEYKINQFQAICGTINRTLNNKAHKQTKLKFYKTMAVPALLYGSESWITTTKHESKIQAAEMKFLRRVKGCTRMDQIRNEDIREELQIYSIKEKITNNKEQWKEHIERMAESRLPKRIQNYFPRGRRDVGRPRKRWS